METRERLLVATIELFRAKGYQGTSLVEVASSARATIGSLYHFFPGGKVALAAEALRTSGAAYQGLFDLVAAGADGTAPATVSAFFDGAADALEETEFLELCPIGSVAREMAGLDDVIRTAAAEVFSNWIEHLTGLLEADGMTETGARELATATLASLEGSFGLARTLRDANLVRTTGTQVRRLVEAAVATAPSAPSQPHRS